MVLGTSTDAEVPILNAVVLCFENVKYLDNEILVCMFSKDSDKGYNPTLERQIVQFLSYAIAHPNREFATHISSRELDAILKVPGADFE